MIDHKLRPLIDPPLNSLAKMLAGQGLKANQVTITGFLIGLTAMPLIAIQYYDLALLAVVLNRVADGLDGALARILGPTNVGAYLDIVLDFIFYSATIFAFALADPGNALSAALLIFSFIGTGSSFLAMSVFAEKLGLSTQAQGAKSLYYLSGLTEGFETILILILMCLLPEWFVFLATLFSILCWITTVSRIKQSCQLLAGS